MAGEKRASELSNVQPSFAEKPIKNGHSYLESRRSDDGSEDGLWRIHNSLYDLTDFIKMHPGGPDWLNLTKGTDITEAVEVHHLYLSKLEPHLKRYYVRDASTPKNMKLTFKPDGFYVTLRNRVGEKVKTMDVAGLKFKSKIIIDSMLILMLTLAIVSAKYNTILLAGLTSFLYTWVIIAAHNYFHIRDNFRMIYFNLSFMSYRDWRISHSLSHHLFPNSLHGVEVMLFEPVLCWLPSSTIKGRIQRYGSWVYGWALYALLFISEFLKKLIMVSLNKCTLYPDELLPLAVPLLMYLLSGSSIWVAVKCYLVIMVGSSFYFSLVGLNAGHHHLEVVHDGDALRDDLDWGIYQIDTVIDRKDIRGNHLLGLIHFGDHCLHHLFPTLEHGVLTELYPILFQTMDEFEVEFKSYPWWQLIRGQFQQLARTEKMTKCSHRRSKYFTNDKEKKVE